MGIGAAPFGNQSKSESESSRAGHAGSMPPQSERAGLSIYSARPAEVLVAVPARLLLGRAVARSSLRLIFFCAWSPSRISSQTETVSPGRDLSVRPERAAA